MSTFTLFGPFETNNNKACEIDKNQLSSLDAAKVQFKYLFSYFGMPKASVMLP